MNGAERPGRPGIALRQQMELPAHLSVSMAPQAAGLPMAGREGQQEGRPVRGRLGSEGLSAREIVTWNRAENPLRALTRGPTLHVRDGRRWLSVLGFWSEMHLSVTGSSKNRVCKLYPVSSRWCLGTVFLQIS